MYLPKYSATSDIAY